MSAGCLLCSVLSPERLTQRRPSVPSALKDGASAGLLGSSLTCRLGCHKVTTGNACQAPVMRRASGEGRVWTCQGSGTGGGFASAVGSAVPGVFVLRAHRPHLTAACHQEHLLCKAPCLVVFHIWPFPNLLRSSPLWKRSLSLYRHWCVTRRRCGAHLWKVTPCARPGGRLSVFLGQCRLDTSLSTHVSGLAHI